MSKTKAPASAIHSPMPNATQAETTAYLQGGALEHEHIIQSFKGHDSRAGAVTENIEGRLTGNLGTVAGAGGRLAALTGDVLGGVRTVLELIEASDFEREIHVPYAQQALGVGVLSNTMRGSLHRMAIQVLGMLEQQQEDHIEWLGRVKP